MQRSRTSPNTYRGDSYDQNHSQKGSRIINVAPRGLPRPPPKRLPEPLDRGPRETSPKRSKPTTIRNLQEVRRIYNTSETVVEKKVSYFLTLSRV